MSDGGAKPHQLVSHALSLASIVVLVIFHLAPIPSLPAIPNASFQLPLDKLGHFAGFFVSALSWRRSADALGARRSGVVTVAFAAVVSAVLEIAQAVFTTTRSGDALDFAAGVAGATLAVFMMRAEILRPSPPA